MASVRLESVVLCFLKQQQVLQQHEVLGGCSHSWWHRGDSCSQLLAPSLPCRQQQQAPQLLELLGQAQAEVPQHGEQEGWWLQPKETIKVKLQIKMIFIFFSFP